MSTPQAGNTRSKDERAQARPTTESQAQEFTAQETQVHAKNSPGFKRLPRATQLSWQGLKACWRYEAGFRQEAVVGALLVPLSFYLAQSIAHWALLIASILLVLLTELLNSAVEAVADAVTLEDNVLIGRAKDLGSAAVFVALMVVLAVWGSALYATFVVGVGGV